MSGAWTTFKRELASYLRSPVGYVIAFLLYLLRGFEVDRLLRLTAAYGIDRERFATAYLMQNSSLMLLILVPAVLTMRVFAEERRSGSLEVLLTAPVRDGAVVLGKWGASFAFFALLWAPAFVLLAWFQDTSYLGTSLTWGPILTGLLGMLLVGALLLAAGCFTSSLTDNQLLASLSAMLFAWVALYGPSQFRAPPVADDGVGATGLDAAWRWLDAQVIRPVLDDVNVADHLQSWFLRGIVNSAHVVFYVAGTAALLFLTTRSLEARRWR
ncbi:MAG: ABC transporter permease [Planctomycetes bacterium]|nr:ABC transporter permease [Planctomycetota bacterium]